MDRGDRVIQGAKDGVFLLLLMTFLFTGCAAPGEPSMKELSTEIDTLIEKSGGEVALYYRDMEGDDSLLISADTRMHAASTMKVPVMIQLFLDQEEGLISLDDSIPVKTSFNSIFDGSPYALNPEDDSETALYLRDGMTAPYRDLIERMITVSSNLATNILIEKADAQRVTATMRTLGADSIVVLRGVEDGPAFRAGLSNTTTARDLGIILSALARGEVVDTEACTEMLQIMSRQRFRTKIPAELPPGVRVAHKTGRITGISHDAGIVFPAGAVPYALVILTRGFEDPEEADALAAQISRIIFDRHVAKHSKGV